VREQSDHFLVCVINMFTFTIKSYFISCVSTLIFILFFFSLYGDHRDLHSFPTRRSSDLREQGELLAAKDRSGRVVRRVEQQDARSEEHTSELQSRENLVCRLLLEKKKKVYRK